MSRGSPLGVVGEVFSALPRIFKLLIVLLLVNAFLIAATRSIPVRVFQNVALVKSLEVGVYEDANCTVPMDANHLIDWGLIEPGGNKTKVVYMKNEGNSEFQLKVYADNWTPLEAGSYMNLTSDIDGLSIPVNSIVRAELVLSLAEDVKDITDFSFTIYVEVVG